METGNGNQMGYACSSQQIPIRILQQTRVAHPQCKDESGACITDLLPDLAGKSISEAVNRGMLSELGDFHADVTLRHPAFLQCTLFGIESAGVVYPIGSTQGDFKMPDITGAERVFGPVPGQFDTLPDEFRKIGAVAYLRFELPLLLTALR